MAAIHAPVSDTLVIVKSREIHRALFAAARRDRAAAARHFLAAAYLELVLAEDYAAAGEAEREFRSRLSAGACLWRAGRQEEAASQWTEVRSRFPDRDAELQSAVEDLTAPADAPSSAEAPR